MTLTLVLVNGAIELVDHRGDLQSGHKNSLLSLDTDVLGPFDETGQVSLGLNVTSNSEVSGALLEKRCLRSGCTGGISNNDLLSFDSFLHLWETTAHQ